MKKTVKTNGLVLLIVASLLVLSTGLQARPNKQTPSIGGGGNAQTYAVQSSGVIEVGFSPEGGAEQLVLKVIGSAKQDIRVMAYSFTSASVTAALLQARRRGVQVSLIVDHKNNTSQDKSGKARAALSALVTAGASVRTISSYPIHHDKVILADAATVELGSFNYSQAAARSNSENALVIWNNPSLAKVYLEHWKSRFDRGQDFGLSY